MKQTLILRSRKEEEKDEQRGKTRELSSVLSGSGQQRCQQDQYLCESVGALSPFDARDWYCLMQSICTSRGNTVTEIYYIYIDIYKSLILIKGGKIFLNILIFYIFLYFSNYNYIMWYYIIIFIIKTCFIFLNIVKFKIKWFDFII